MTTFRDLVRAGMLEIGDGYRAKNEELGGEGPVFLRSAYLQDKGWILDDPDRFSTFPAGGFGSKVARVGDTVLTTKGNSLGRLGLVDARIAGAIYSPHLSYWRSLDHEELAPRYLYYWARSTAAGHQIKARSESTDMAPYLSLADQKALRIELPAIGRQREVADVLGGLDDKIELNRRMAETLEAMVRALFKSWFIDFDPVRAKAQGRPTGLPEELLALFPNRLDDDGLPSGWQRAGISEAFDLLGGGTPKTSVSDYWNGSVPWFSVVDAPDNSAPFVLATERTISPLGLDNCASELLPTGATIITARGTVGKLAIVGVPMAMNQSCYAAVAKDGYSDYFVYFLLRYALQDLNTRSHGSVFNTITRQTFEGVRAPLPASGVVPAFDRLASPLMDTIKARLQQSRTLASLRDTLLPKLISGELRMGDADERFAAA